MFLMSEATPRSMLWIPHHWHNPCLLLNLFQQEQQPPCLLLKSWAPSSSFSLLSKRNSWGAALWESYANNKPILLHRGAIYCPEPCAKKMAVQNVSRSRLIFQGDTNWTRIKFTEKMANFDHSFLIAGRTILTASDMPYLFEGLPLFGCVRPTSLGHAFLFVDMGLERSTVVTILCRA